MTLGGDKVIGFVAEPVVGATLGAVPSVPGYFEAMRAICDRHGILLIPHLHATSAFVRGGSCAPALAHSN